MTEQNKPLESEKVACAVCLKEIPISEEKSGQAVDYVIHYCSLECYDTWQKQSEKTNQKE